MLDSFDKREKLKFSQLIIRAAYFHLTLLNAKLTCGETLSATTYDIAEYNQESVHRMTTNTRLRCTFNSWTQFHAHISYLTPVLHSLSEFQILILQTQKPRETPHNNALSQLYGKVSPRLHHSAQLILTRPAPSECPGQLNQHEQIRLRASSRYTFHIPQHVQTQPSTYTYSRHEYTSNSAPIRTIQNVTKIEWWRM